LWLLLYWCAGWLWLLLCGAAGFYIGQAVFFSGASTRVENLARRGRGAGVVILGAVGLFFFAGLIEGIFRQTVQDLTSRYGMVAATSLLWILYFGVLGRREAMR